MPEYTIWKGMKARCANPTLPGYPDYGGRGITVCDRWIVSFAAFFDDMGPRPPEHSLERRNNDLGYSPENCYWATGKEQGRNKRNNLLLTHEGETLCASAWAERSGVLVGTLHHRISHGWPMERALNPEHGGKGMGKVTLNCDFCGREFIAYRKQAEKTRRHFCSAEHFRLHMKRGAKGGVE